MNFGGNSAFDLAELRAEEEREAAIAAASAALRGKGKPECEDCGLDIPDSRRRSMPSATCCVDCQTRRELKGRK